MNHQRREDLLTVLDEHDLCQLRLGRYASGSDSDLPHHAALPRTHRRRNRAAVFEEREPERTGPLRRLRLVDIRRSLRLRCSAAGIARGATHRLDAVGA